MLGLLASAGISIFTDLIKDKGADLVEAGIEKVTGIKLKNREEPLTPEEITRITESELKVKELDFKILEAKEKAITERWISDNKSGGINSKVRPYALIYLLIVITIFALTDGNIGEFKIATEWKTLFTSLAITAFGGYFVLRTYEKGKGKH